MSLHAQHHYIRQPFGKDDALNLAITIQFAFLHDDRPVDDEYGLTIDEMTLDAIESDVDRVLRHTISHAYMMLAAFAEGTAGSDRHTGHAQQVKRELHRVPVRGANAREYVVGTFRCDVIENMRHAIQTFTDQRTPFAKNSLELGKVWRRRGQSSNPGHL